MRYRANKPIAYQNCVRESHGLPKERKKKTSAPPFEIPRARWQRYRDTLADEINKRLIMNRHCGIRYAITVVIAIFANRRCRRYDENERRSAVLSLLSDEAARDYENLHNPWKADDLVYLQSEYRVQTKQKFSFFFFLLSDKRYASVSQGIAILFSDASSKQNCS